MSLGHFAEQKFDQYPGKTPDSYKRCIDDIVGSIDEPKRLLPLQTAFIPDESRLQRCKRIPSLKFTRAISDEQLPSVDWPLFKANI